MAGVAYWFMFDSSSGATLDTSDVRRAPMFSHHLSGCIEFSLILPTL
jgi:hypothetical protein